MTFREFLATSRVYWKAFSAVSVAVLAGGVAWLVLTPVQYVSHAQLLVTISGSMTANGYQNDSVVASRVNSYVALMTTDAVTQRVADKLGSPSSAAELAARITAVQVPNTAVIDIAAAAPSPAGARELADAVAGEFIGYAEAIEAPTGEDAQKVRTTVVSGATEPRSRLLERIAVGGLFAVLAVLLGAAAVWLRAVTDPVIRTPQRAAAAAGLPVLDEVAAGPADRASGDFARLRRRLDAGLTPASEGGNVIQFVSAGAFAAPMEIVHNLSGAWEAAGLTCAVIDVVSEENARPPAPHVLGYRSWSASPDRSTRRAAAGLLDKLRREFDRVAVVSDGSTGSSDTFAGLAERVVLLVALGRSTRRSVADSAAALSDAGVACFGVVPVTAVAGRR